MGKNDKHTTSASDDAVTASTQGGATLGRRRALRIAGMTAAGVGAAAAAAAAGASPAGAAPGNPLILGQDNDAGSAETSIRSINSAGITGLSVTAFGGDSIGLAAAGSGQGVYCSGNQAGVLGDSDSGIGVKGQSGDGFGVSGTSKTNFGVVGSSKSNHGGSFSSDDAAAVYAYGPIGMVAFGIDGDGIEGHGNNGHGVVGSSSNRDGVRGAIPQNTGAGLFTGVAAVHGTAQDTLFGVVGETNEGIGVYGLMGDHSGLFSAAAVCGDSKAGTGVLGVSSTGTGVWAQTAGTNPALKAVGKGGVGAALDVHGTATFTRSGVLTIPAGASSATTAAVPGGLTGTSHVLATMQTNAGGNVAVKAAVPNTGTGKITVFLTANAPTALKIAWFVVG